MRWEEGRKSDAIYYMPARLGQKLPICARMSACRMVRYETRGTREFHGNMGHCPISSLMLLLFLLGS